MHTIKHEALDPILAALRELPAAAPATEAAVTARDASLAYLEARREEVCYAEFQAMGYPIGSSGVVESAGKLVVEARLKGGGMHRAPAHVNHRVALRSTICPRRLPAAWPAVLQPLRRRFHERSRPRGCDHHPPATPLPQHRPTCDHP